MITHASITAQPNRLTSILRRGWAINRPLMLLALASTVTLLVSLIGLIIDPRAASAAPGWIKPTKFAISLAVYSATFLWLLSFVRGRPRTVRFIATATAITSAVELGIIAIQVVRGTYSHYNVATPLDATMWYTMAVAIVLLWVMCLVLGVLLLIQRLPNPTIAWGLRLGVLVALVGMALGFLMTVPTSSQLATLTAGQPPTLIGAHTVGSTDGGPGLPFVGWSTTGGDLRVGHFFGLHGMQIIPLLALLLLRSLTWLREGQRVLLVVVGASGYLGLIALLTWQALRGQSVIAPDGATLTALAILLVAVVLAAGGVLLHARRTQHV